MSSVPSMPGLLCEFEREFIADRMVSSEVMKELSEMIRTVIREEIAEEELFQLHLAVAEATGNIWLHAYEKEPRRFGVNAAVVGDRSILMIKFVDDGKKPDPERFISRALDDFRSGGLGLNMMSRIMDRVEMVCSEDFNVLTMVRRLDGRDRSERPPFHVLRIEGPNAQMVYLYGECVEGSIWPLDAREAASGRVELDLLGVSGVDDAGIAEITAFARRVKNAGCAFELRAVSERVRRTLRGFELPVLQSVPQGLGEDLFRGADILVVSEDSGLLRQLESLVNGVGGRIRGAANAVEFQSAVAQSVPDLAVLSLDLPCDESEALFWAFRASPGLNATPLVLTGRRHSYPEMVEYCDDVDDFCPLPAKTMELKFRLLRVLDRARRASGSLPVLRAIGRRCGVEALENFSMQFAELREFGSAFLSAEKFARERVTGWSRWGQMSNGSVVHCAVSRGKAIVGFGRGGRTGYSSILEGVQVGGLFRMNLDDSPHDISAVAADLCRQAARLLPAIDPYYVALVSYDGSKGWLAIEGDGPPIALYFDQIKKRIRSIRSMRIDAPTNQLREVRISTPSRPRFVSPSLFSVGKELWESSLECLRTETADREMVDAWVFEVNAS